MADTVAEKKTPVGTPEKKDDKKVVEKKVVEKNVEEVDEDSKASENGDLDKPKENGTSDEKDSSEDSKDKDAESNENGDSTDYLRGESFRSEHALKRFEFKFLVGLGDWGIMHVNNEEQLSSPVASLVLTERSQLTSDSQHLESCPVKRKSGAGDAPDGTPTEGASPEKKAKLEEKPAAEEKAEANGKEEVAA
uniref:Uncharacterized protein n=1 Tax=Timema poppense TaxID=170557 RepID=A0A7R9HCJ7_TIMPO|nr:unnamed protein product [Timema poppensis]